MKGAKGLYFGANNAVLAPVSFVHRRRRRYENVLKVPSSGCVADYHAYRNLCFSFVAILVSFT